MTHIVEVPTTAVMVTGTGFIQPLATKVAVKASVTMPLSTVMIK